MKKLAIGVAVMLASFGAASAADTTSNEQMPAALPPVMTTGSSTIDAQIKALRQSYESQIKTLREEYASKLKAIVGDKKPMMGTSTRPLGKDMKDGKEHVNGPTTPGDRKPMPLQGKVEGTSVEGEAEQNGATPKGNAWGFFKKFFGIQKEDK